MLIMRFEKVAILLAFIFVLVSAYDFEDNKCESKFCEEDPNYPEQLLDSLKLWELDLNSQTEHQSRKRSISPTTSDSFLIETKLCDSSISFKRPQKLKNIDNKLRTIVNHRNYTQLVRFEICSSQNFPCTYNVYPKTVASYCQSVLRLVPLLAYDEDEHNVVNEKFLIPSSCDCMIDKGDLFRGVHNDILKN